MSEDQDKAVDEKAEREPESPVGGELLAQARREQQISVLEVAKELHLDEPKVRALERNEFDVLGAPVFAKGHLRKYAQLVGVDPDDILADYYKMTHTAELPPVVVGRAKIRPEFSPGPWIAVIIVILAAATAYWWFAVESENAPAESPTNEAPAPAPEQDSQSTSPAVNQPEEDETIVVEEQPIVVADAVQAESVPEPLPDGQTRISLNFSGDCWAEISDATGQRLFFEMGRIGRNVELTGTAPFAVLFGNVENVSVRVDGSDYPISPSTPGSRTARLTIIKP